MALSSLKILYFMLKDFFLQPTDKISGHLRAPKKLFNGADSPFFRNYRTISSSVPLMIASMNPFIRFLAVPLRSSLCSRKNPEGSTRCDKCKIPPFSFVIPFVSFGDKSWRCSLSRDQNHYILEWGPKTNSVSIHLPSREY